MAWRAGIIAHTPLWRSVPKQGAKSHGAVGPRDAAALLVLRAARDREGRCWLRVRLPSRPNNAAAWVRADRVLLRPTRWRIVVSRRARTISVYHDGDLRRRFRVVVGTPGTPTPRGLFSIVGVWRWNPADFLGSYILPLTAHSKVLQEFGGGDGRVGIHGRGGASLLDPLGSARSHGCIRLSNKRSMDRPHGGRPRTAGHPGPGAVIANSRVYGGAAGIPKTVRDARQSYPVCPMRVGEFPVRFAP